MIRKDLLAMRPLKATARMLEIERADVPREIPGRYGVYRKYNQFARCRVENGILKVALFFPDNLRTGGRWPSYEVFVDRPAGTYITYDRMTDKWRTAAVNHLDWPRYIYATDGTWMSQSEAKMVQTYLGGSRGGYDGVLDYQEQLLGKALKRRHKRETDPWDADLSLTPGLPRDWVTGWTRWAFQRIIFFTAMRGKAPGTGTVLTAEGTCPSLASPAKTRWADAPSAAIRSPINRWESWVKSMLPTCTVSICSRPGRTGSWFGSFGLGGAIS